ncbi:MAG: four-carbon acid sugar kinase family protein [Candidatus Muiribacteriota bacterium]
MSENLRKWLFIADDLTGAGDVGVQLRRYNDEVYLYTTSKPRISPEQIVYDMQTRDLKKNELQGKFDDYFNIINQYKIVFKKIDSTLRGNIKEEFNILKRKYTEATFYFIPAFPEMNRVTKNGIHYVKDIPLKQTSYARAPSNPAWSERVCDYFPQKSEILKLKPDELNNADKIKTDKKFVCFDCETQQDLKKISDFLLKKINNHKKSFITSAAGLLNTLQCSMGLHNNEDETSNIIKLQTLFFCGSLQTVNKEIINNLNIETILIDEEMLLKHNDYIENIKVNINKKLIFGKSVAVFLRGEKILKNQTKELDFKLAQIFKKIYKLSPRIVLSGGNTAYNCLKSINKFFFKVEHILSTGIPGLTIGGSYIIIKPGGFGDEKFWKKILEDNV